jgi:hypothetical protein
MEDSGRTGPASASFSSVGPAAHGVPWMSSQRRAVARIGRPAIIEELRGLTLSELAGKIGASAALTMTQSGSCRSELVHRRQPRPLHRHAPEQLMSTALLERPHFSHVIHAARAGNGTQLVPPANIF